jgi:hypothetical protein
MTVKSTEPGDITGTDALHYIQELTDSLREMAAGLGHDTLADLLTKAAAEAGRLADS